MLSKLEIAKLVFKKEGIFSLVRKAFKHYVLSFLYLLACFIKVRNVKSRRLVDLVNFAFNGCYGYIKPTQVKSEIISLLKLVKDIRPKTIMEIGTLKGGTLFLFSKVIPRNSLVISLDLPGGEFGGGYPWWKVPLYRSFSQNKQILRLIREDSHSKDTFKKIKNILGDRKIDFLFIDGDHTYEGVKNDFELYSQLVKKGGFIAFHDIVPHPPETKCEVNKFWGKVKKKYEHKEFVEDWQITAGIGIIRI